MLLAICCIDENEWRNGDSKESKREEEEKKKKRTEGNDGIKEGVARNAYL